MVEKVTHKGFEKILREGVEKPHNLGDKLYLVIKGNSRDFSFRYTKDGKTRKYSLKPYHPKTNTLSDARKQATELNALLARGVDPHDERKRLHSLQAETKNKQLIADKLKENTFEKVSYDLINAKADDWTNSKSRQAWENTLKRYAFPVIGHLPVSEIDKTHILKILEPIWKTKYETARKLRQRIEAVFSRAIYFDLRKASNPAAYKDNLEIPLPIPKNRQAQHHAALNYKELPEFMFELKKMPGVAARALEFLILNASRTTEVRKARWSEFDLEKRIWVIPVEEGRMGKTKKSHIVPLSSQSIKILKTLDELRLSEYVFPNTRSNGYLSEAGMDSVIKRMSIKKDWKDDYGKKITVHGFRSTMRDYVAEQTDFDAQTAETALAHQVGTSVERAYRRGDLLEKRRALMQFYGDYAWGVASLEKRHK
jgi:integrase